MKKTFRNIILVVFFTALFSTAPAGCLSTANVIPGNPSGETVFLPPTLPVPEEEIATGEVNVPAIQPTPPCQNGLAFITDVTIPDGALVAPGSSIEKSWEVENVGSCGWTAEYSIRHVGGSNLGAETSLPLYPARAGARAVISIRFTAPLESGTIHSAWRAYGPDGQPFGDAVYVQINVSTSQPSDSS